MSTKKAQTDHPVHELIAARWSPYGYSDRAVPAEDLRSILEAARWAPSSYNEQPWSFLLATREDAAGFERMLSCLVEPNQAWARHAPVLMLGVTSLHFARNDKPNAAAFHDLGLAAGNLCLEAAARGVMVHQMIGILPERAEELYDVPDGQQVFTGLALGYPADPSTLDEKLRERDRAPRTRKALGEFVFAGKWGEAAGLVG